MTCRPLCFAFRLIALLAMALSFVACGSQEEQPDDGGGSPPGGPPPALVRVDVVKQETVIQRRLVTGQLEPSQHSVVAAEESGRVTLAPPDAGTAIDSIKTDLAKLDTTILARQKLVAEAELETAKASEAEVQARLDQATAQRKRLEALVKDGSVAENDFDLAVRDEQVADAQLKVVQSNIVMREAALEVIKDRLAKMTVPPPFVGVVIEEHTELGQWLAAGSPVVTMVQLDPIDAVLDVPEHMVDQLAVGREATLKINGLNIERQGSHRRAPVVYAHPPATAHPFSSRRQTFRIPSLVIR